MSKPTILIVDDDLRICDMLTQVLSLEGYALETANNGQEAVAVMNRAPQVSRVLLLDLTMPVLDGWGVVRWLVEHPDTKQHTTIILMSAAEKLKLASDLEHDGELTKPFGIDMLLDTLARHIA